MSRLLHIPVLTLLLVLALLPQVLRVRARSSNREPTLTAAAQARQLEQAAVLRGELLQRQPFALVENPLAARERPGKPVTPYSGSPDDVAAINRWLRRTADASNGYGRVVELARSRHGRPLLGLLMQAPGTVPLARLAIVARQHGDEPVTTMAALHLAHRLLLRPTLHSRESLGRVAVLVVPLANVDGASADTRSNSAVVDLNRDWDSPSTAETQALRRFLRKWAPQVLVDVHQWVPGDPYAGSMVLVSPGKANVRLGEAMRRACATAGLQLARETWGRWSRGMLTVELGTGRSRALLELPAAHSRAAKASSARTGTLALLGAVAEMSEQLAAADHGPQFTGLQLALPKPGWYLQFAGRLRYLDGPALRQVATMLPQQGNPAQELLRARVGLELLDTEHTWECARRAAGLDEYRAEAAYLQGLALYLRGDWQRAADLLALCLAEAPSHRSAKAYRTRCLEHLRSAPWLSES